MLVQKDALGTGGAGVYVACKRYLSSSSPSQSSQLSSLHWCMALNGVYELEI